MSKTLLLADDSSTIQRVVELTFATEDIRVVSVTDGEQAMKALGQNPPDIVVADIGMPRVDGYEVSSHVKKTPALQHIPVLLLAGAFEPVDDARVRAAQCDGVLIKPFEPRQLVNRVLELIRNAAAQQAAAPAAPITNGHAAAEHEHQTPAWYRPEPSASMRVPPAPVMDASLDAGLSAMPAAPAPRTPAAAPVMAAVPVPEPAAPDPVSSPMSIDLTFDPSIGTEPEKLDWSSHNPDGSLELQALPGDLEPEPAPPPLAAAPAPKATPPAPAAGQPGDKVALSTAFSALLAAEQTHGGGESTAAMTDAALEEMMRRMLLRVTDDVVRKVVLEAAERMVKEEIDRIKSEPESASSEPESASGTEPETK